MAIVQHPLLGQLSGRIGDVVFYNYRGKTCVRGRGRKPRVPATMLQLQQHSRIRAVAIFYRAMVAAGLKEAWEKASEGSLLNGYTLFVRFNVRVFSGEGLITDFSRIRLVTGRLPLPDMLVVKRLAPATIGVSWKLKSRCVPRQLADRLVLAFMKCETVYTVHVPEIAVVCRSACGARIELPESLAACPHCYCFFRSDLSGDVTESRYFYLNE